MTLPKDLSIKFKDTIFHYEEDRKMPYITSVERLGIEKGIKEGKKEGIKEGKKEGIKEGKKEGFLLASQKYLSEILNERFGEDAVKIIRKIKKIKSVETLDKLFRYALRADTVEEFTDIIDNLQ
jgi:predicted transposase YdaD